MRICDKCLKRPVAVTLKFKTKSFQLCEVCAKKIVAWLEKPTLREAMGNLYKNTLKTGMDFTKGGGI